MTRWNGLPFVNWGLHNHPKADLRRPTLTFAHAHPYAVYSRKRFLVGRFSNLLAALDVADARDGYVVDEGARYRTVYAGRELQEVLDRVRGVQIADVSRDTSRNVFGGTEGLNDH